VLSTQAEGTRRRGRRARQVERQDPTAKMLPTLQRNLPLVEPMTPDQIEKIDGASMDILENVGVVFRDDVAVEDWKRAGADVRDGIARNPDNNVGIGNNACVFVPMTGAPYLRDLDDERRSPTLDDLAMFHKLSQMSPAMHSSAHHIVEPMDHAISHRHLRITYSSMKYSDKMFMGMTTSPKNAEDVLDMSAILFGGDEFLGDARV